MADGFSAVVHKSVRTVYAPDEIVHILSEHIRLHLPTKQPRPMDVPRARAEHPLHQNSVGNLWQRELGCGDDSAGAVERVSRGVRR